MTTYKGTTGNDTITGSANDDNFDVEQGGEDTVNGLAGNDIFHFVAQFDAGDTIDGGAGSDTLLLRGDYSAGIVFTDTTMVSVEKVQLGAGYNYKLTTADATVAAGASLFVDAAPLGAANALTFNGSAETNGTFVIEGGAGNDVLTGGAGNDVFRLDKGGEDTVQGGGGDDVFAFGGALDAGDSIDGGTGRNTIRLDANYASLTLGANTIKNIQNVQFDPGHNYNITTNDGNFAPGTTIEINGSALAAGNTLTFDAAAESSATFKIYGGAGNDVLTGGNGENVFELTKGGNDCATGGTGRDIFEMGAALTAADRINGGGGTDTLELDGNYATKLTFSATTMTRVGTLLLDAGHSYNLATNDANVAAGATLLVNGQGLAAGNVLTFNGSAETDGSFTIRGGAGNDVLTGGAQADAFNLSLGGIDTVHGGSGNDTISVSAANVSADTIDGGAGNDTIAITGSGALTLSGAKITNVETVSFADSGSYTAAVTGNVAGSGALSIDAAALTGSHVASVDMSAATSAVNFTGGAGNDVLTVGSNLGDLGAIDGGAGDNTLAFSGSLVKPTLSDANITHVEKLVFADGGSYPNIAISGDLTGTHGTLDVDASALTGSTSITVNAMQATSGIDFTGGAGDDTLVLSDLNIANAGTAGDGGAGDNLLQIDAIGSPLTLSLTGAQFQHFDQLDFAGSQNIDADVANDFVGSASTLTIDAFFLTGSATVDVSGITSATVDYTGGSGNDTIVFNAAAQNWGLLNGENGNDTLKLTGGGSVTLSGSDVHNFTTLALTNGDYSDVTIAGDITTGDPSLSIDASTTTGATVDLSQATTASINFTGGAGDDTVIFSSDNDNWGTVNGGAGNNTFEFDDGSAAIVSGASVTNFSTLSFADGHDYSGIQVTGDITGDSGTLDVSAGALTGSNSVSVDVSQATSTIDFTGGAGDDTIVFAPNLAKAGTVDGGGGDNTLGITGGGSDVSTTFDGASLTNFVNFDTLALENGNNYDVTVTSGFAGSDTLTIDASGLSSNYGATVDVTQLNATVNFLGGAGDDTIIFGANIGDAGTVDGGAGTNALALTGDGSDVTTSFDGSTFSNFSTLALEDGNNYNVTVTSGFADSDTLTIDASGLGASFSATVDASDVGSPTSPVTVNFLGGAGDDTVTINDGFVGAINGGGGDNTLVLAANGANQEFDGGTVTGIDNIVYAAGTDADDAFTGDLTGDGGVLAIDETNAVGADGFATVTDVSGLTSDFAYTGSTGDDTILVGSQNWTQMDGGTGNNAIDDESAAPLAFNADTIANFDQLNFIAAYGSAPIDFTGISVVGDLTGDSGTLGIDASQAGSLSIDVSQATSPIKYLGSGGDDIIVFGNSFSNSDVVDGLLGDDTLSLGRNTVTLSDTAISGISTVTLGDTSTFAIVGDITANGRENSGLQSYLLNYYFGSTPDNNGTLDVNAGALTDPHQSTDIDFSQATTTTIDFTGAAGNDSVTFSAARDNWGAMDGGAGHNSFILTGGGAASIDGADVTDFSTIVLRDGGTYTLSLSGDIQGSGGTLSVDADALTGSNSVVVDASASADKISFIGGAGDDAITGSNNGDFFGLTAGGRDSVFGGAGDDTIDATASAVGGDSFIGGGGTNTVDVSGAGEADFSDENDTNIQILNLASDGVVVTGDITGGQTLTINATDLSGVTIDLTQVTTTSITINGGAGSDTLLVTTDTLPDVVAYSGGGGSDTLALSDANDSGDWNVGAPVFQGLTDIVIDNAGALTISGDVTGTGGTLTVDASALGSSDTVDVDFSAATSLVNIIGGAGGDTFTAGNSLVAGDSINGGGGDDQVTLSGNYQDLTLTATTLTNIALLSLESGSFNITTDDGTVAAGQVLTVSAEFLGQGNTLTFNGAAETDGSFDFQALSSSIANGDVTLIGGAGDDTLDIDSSFSTITLDDNHFQSIETVDFFTGTLTVTGNITSSPIGTLTVSSVGGSGFLTTVDVSQATTPTIDFAGGDGDDTLIFGSNLGNVGAADGGGGINTMELTGNGTDVAAGFVGANFANFTPTLTLEDGNNYHLYVESGFAGDATLTVDASQLSSSYGAIVDVSRAAIGDVDFTGGAGDDTIVFGNGFSQVGNVDGGGGTNTIGLAGSGTGANIVANFDGSEFANFSGLQLEEGNSYDITVVNGFTGNDVITIDASQLTSGYRTSIDVSLISQTVNFSGGTDDDTIIFGANIGNAGTVDGGGGTNTLELTGNGSDVTTDFAGANFTNFPSLELVNGNNYDITATSYFNGGGLSVDAYQISQNFSVTLDVSQLGASSSALIDFTGGQGDDTIIFGTSDLGSAGTVDGGGGTNTLDLIGGSSSSPVDFAGANFANFQSLNLEDGYNYDITATSAFAGGGLSVDASQLSQNFGVTLDVSQLGASTNSSALIDFTGGAGDDTIIFGSNIANAGTVDGGAGDDTLVLNGGGTDLTATLADETIYNIQHLSLDDGNNYDLTITGDITTGGATLGIDASALTGTNAVTVDVSGATTTAVDFAGSAGDDTVIFSGYGANMGTVDGGAGYNTLRDAGGFTLSDQTVTNIQNVVYSDYNYSAGLTVTGDITGGSGTLHIDASGVGNGALDYVDLTGATTPVIDFTGGESQDVVTFGSNFNSNDVLSGGLDSSNVLAFDGNGTDVTATLSSSQITDFGAISLYDGNNYNLTVEGDITTGGDTLYVYANALTGSNGLTLDLSSAMTASINVTGGAGNDVITTGNPASGSYVDLSLGGNDTFVGGAGANTIYMGDTLDANDSITGGSGTNYLVLEGDSYSSGFALDAGMLHNINYVKVLGDHTYVLTGDPASLTGLNSGAALTVDGGAMTGGSLQFDGSAITDGTFSLYGGAGDDILKGGSGNDTLDLSTGGEDQLAGNGGNDIINAGGGLDAGDQVDGGAGSDTLNFNGDYSGGLVLGATTVINVETFKFAAGYSYNITTNDATVAAGATLTVNASTLGASDQLIFNGSAETNGSFVITGGAGNDVLTGGAGNDIFHLGSGGDDTVQGGAGNDVIYGEAGYSSGDTIDGGTGTNNFWLGGKDYTGASAVTFTATNFLNIQTIDLNSSHNYSLTMNDANVAAGATMEVDGHLAKSFTFDGSAETDGYFTIVASTGSDVLTGGALSDTFVFDAVNYSTGTTYDAITNLNFSSDILDLGASAGGYAPTGIDTAVTTGSLSTATFNSDLTADLSGHLAAHHAVLFTADSGTLSGHTFLVVDANGTAGYQASADYVIDVTGYTGTLSTSSFI